MIPWETLIKQNPLEWILLIHWFLCFLEPQSDVAVGTETASTNPGGGGSSRVRSGDSHLSKMRSRCCVDQCHCAGLALFGCQAALHPLTKHTCAYTCARVLTHTCMDMNTYAQTYTFTCTHSHAAIFEAVVSFFMFLSPPSLDRVDRQSPFREVFIGPHLTPREVAQVHRTKSMRLNGLLYIVHESLFDPTISICLASHSIHLDQSQSLRLRLWANQSLTPIAATPPGEALLLWSMWKLFVKDCDLRSWVQTIQTACLAVSFGS